MLNRLYFICVAAVLSVSTFPQFSAATEPLKLEARRELFVDRYLIDKLNNVELRLHSPREEEDVLKFDAPWEGPYSAYGTVLKYGDKFRMYYRGNQKIGVNEVTCYAESLDGISWSKPNLGMCEFDGNKNNNIMIDEGNGVTHNFTPFIDTNPAAKPEEKLKALGGLDKYGLYAYTSVDGIHWKKLQDTPVFTSGVFDSQNVASWSVNEQEYVCYFRSWSEGGFNGIRTVSRTTSKDFINWTPPERMTFGDTPLEHLYTNQTSPYFRAPHIAVSIGARFMPNRRALTADQQKNLDIFSEYVNDCSDAILMTTRGGNVYDRTFMESFMRPEIGSENWGSRSNFPLLNVVRTSPERLSLYTNKNFGQPTSYVKRYSLRVDGFASLNAGYVGGFMVTKPFTFAGNELEINYNTSAAGSVKIEILEEDSNPISGFSGDESQEIIGNEIKRVVTWRWKTDVSELAGKPIRLKIHLKDADIYSFKFN